MTRRFAVQRFRRWLSRCLQRATRKAYSNPEELVSLSDVVRDIAKARRTVRYVLSQKPDWNAVEREQLAAYHVMCVGLQRRPPKCSALV